MSKKEGAPINRALIRLIWAGTKGYTAGRNSSTKDTKNEKIFFTKNREADRSMLLITRLPSRTIWGRASKLESSSTIWETCWAASLPAAMATEQSASLRASTSLTPSPSMATVWPLA